jgi:hypothetical protein
MRSRLGNPYGQLRELLPQPPLQAGTVLDRDAGMATVELPGGGRIQARNPQGLAVGQRVFVRDGLIEGAAPNLTLQIIDI